MRIDFDFIAPNAQVRTFAAWRVAMPYLEQLFKLNPRAERVVGIEISAVGMTAIFEYVNNPETTVCRECGREKP